MSEFIICHYLDYIHIADVQSFNENEIILKDDKSWNRIVSRNNITYQSTHSPSDSGPKKVENVTIKSFQSTVADLLNKGAIYIALIFR